MLPKYAQVKEEISSWINQGKILPDQKIPTENELMQQFGVSRAYHPQSDRRPRITRSAVQRARRRHLCRFTLC